MTGLLLIRVIITRLHKHIIAQMFYIHVVDGGCTLMFNVQCSVKSYMCVVHIHVIIK